MLRLTLEDFDSKNTIVHLHGWTKALSSSVVRECVDKNFSIVCTLHDYFVACPNGGFYNFRTHKICHLHPLSTRCVLENCDSRVMPRRAGEWHGKSFSVSLAAYPVGLAHS